MFKKELIRSQPSSPDMGNGLVILAPRKAPKRRHQKLLTVAAPRGSRAKARLGGHRRPTWSISSHLGLRNPGSEPSVWV